MDGSAGEMTACTPAFSASNRLSGRNNGVNLLQGTPVPKVIEIAARPVNLTSCATQRFDRAGDDEQPAVELVRQLGLGPRRTVRGAKGVGHIEVIAEDFERYDVHNDEARAARSAAKPFDHKMPCEVRPFLCGFRNLLFRVRDMVGNKGGPVARRDRSWNPEILESRGRPS